MEIGQKIKRPRSSALAVVTDMEIFIPLEGIIDVKKEAGRLKDKLKDLEKILKSTDKKLKNKQFLNRAPQEIIAREKEKKIQFKESIKKLKSNLKGLQ